MALIVIADDDTFNCDILSEMLRRMGYDNIKTFYSGKSAWEYIQEDYQNISVAILDKMMPCMGGRDIFKQMRSDSKYDHIPVIFQSADACDKHIMEDLESGIHGYVAKPFDPESLQELLDKALT